MKKFKEFISKIFKKIKCWFMLYKPLIKKIFILLYVFCFGLGVGGCIECLLNSKQTASAKTVNGGNNLIYDNVLTFELGDTVQYIHSSNGSVQERRATVGIPTIINIDFSGSIDWVNFSVDFGYVGSTFSTSQKNAMLGNSYSLSFNNTDGADGNPDWLTTSITIPIGDIDYNISYAHMFRYTGFINTNYEGGHFGYMLPRSVGYTTTGQYGTNNYEINSSGTTYFLMGCIDTPTEATSVVKYNKQVITLGDNFNFNGNTMWFKSFLVHTFVCNNGALYFYGYSIPSRFPTINSNSLYTYNYTYDFVTGDYQQGYDDGYNVGYGQGFTDGEINGSQVGNEHAYQNGYNKGYLDGTDVALKDVNPFNAVLSFVDSMLSIKLFKTISIGDILGLIFGLVMVGIVIKMFLGG